MINKISGGKMENKRLKLGELLLYAGKITKKQLKDALDIQKKSGKKLGEVLVSDYFVNRHQFMDSNSTLISIIARTTTYRFIQY